MTDTLKGLAQSSPAAGALTDIYTVPSVTSAMVSSVVVCNQGTSPATFRLAHAVAGAADTAAQYLYYDMPVPAKQTFIATIGLSLATTDVLRAYASASGLSFNVYGVQVT